MKKIYITPELEVISDVESTIMAGSGEPTGSGNTLYGGGTSGNEHSHNTGTDATDEDLDMGAKGGGYVAWGMDWDDEF